MGQNFRTSHGISVFNQSVFNQSLIQSMSKKTVQKIRAASKVIFESY